jgi:hypothetical protein
MHTGSELMHAGLELMHAGLELMHAGFELLSAMTRVRGGVAIETTNNKMILIY